MAHIDRRELRAVASRQRVLQAAKELLAEGGEAGLSIEALAERADVAVQTIYNRVGGRSAILLALAEQAFRENRHYMDAAYAVEATPIERVRAAGEAYLRFSIERPHEFRLLVEPPRLPETLSTVAELTAEQNGKLAAAIADGIADGSMRADLDPATLATLLWAGMNGILALQWRPDALQISPRRAGEVLILLTDLLERAVRP